MRGISASIEPRSKEEFQIVTMLYNMSFNMSFQKSCLARFKDFAK